MMMLLLIMMMMMTIKAKHTRSFCGAHPSGANVVGGPRAAGSEHENLLLVLLFVVAAFFILSSHKYGNFSLAISVSDLS